jgi:hypothetical protein
MMGSEAPVRYLFGDSTESDLEFDYLAFIREVIDCAVVMAECEVTLGVTVEDRRSRELETASVIAAVADLGTRVSQLVTPIAADQASAPIGRCAAAIAAAIRDAVDKESAQARATLAAECDEMDRQDQRQRARAKSVLEKLLRTHDLPGADKELEVTWTTAGVKATMRQRTGFGVEAVLSLDIPASSLLGLDLRVDRIAENVEVHGHETGGWLKKSDKVVAHKLGRYQVTNVKVAGDATRVRLRASPEANAGGFVITARRNGDLGVEPTGDGPSREVAIDDRDRTGLRLLIERLEAAVRGLTETRTGLVSVDIDGGPITQHAHPRVLAERLIAAVAPTIQKIAQHSRSPGELVLRRLIGDHRREEIFVSTADLLKRLDGLPAHARELFAPLQLGGEPVKPPVDEPRPAAKPTAEVKPAPVPLPIERSGAAVDRRFDTESEPRPEPRPEARPPVSRTTPPPAPMSEARSGLARLPSALDARRATRPTQPTGESPFGEPPLFDDKASPFSASRADPTPPTAAKPAPVLAPAQDARAAPRGFDKPLDIAAEPSRKRTDDSVLSDAIDRAIDESDGTPSPK